MTHHVQILLFDGVQSLDVTGPLEVFTLASTPDAVRYRVTTASADGKPVHTSSGLKIVPDTAFASGPDAVGDTVIVPGGDGTYDPQPAIVEWLQRHGERPTRIMSVCTGAFLLAEAGLLDGRRATTHWLRCGTLARRFPLVTVDPSPIYVRDGRVSTSAGVTSGIDLALALVEEDHGRDLALAIARALVLYLRRPGGQPQVSVQLSGQVAHRAPLRDVQRHIAEHPAADLSVPALAARANLSPRQFTRAFTAETGTSPGRWVDRVRLETARRLLEETPDSVNEIARASGFGTAEALRRAFDRSAGTTPTEYRKQLQDRINA